MPRIEPDQLLHCLEVLLSPEGGILSEKEVQRLANLMQKFSKKLVSKCIYVLILKSSETHLLNSFMSEGGWNLVHMWLQDAHTNKNWPLVTEILELLLLTPVDVERLKMNNLPKLIKGLTKRDDLIGIQQLAARLVDEWLKIVKDVTRAEMANQQILLQQQQQILIDQQRDEEPEPQNLQQPAEEIVVEENVTHHVEVEHEAEPIQTEEVGIHADDEDQEMIETSTVIEQPMEVVENGIPPESVDNEITAEEGAESSGDLRYKVAINKEGKQVIKILAIPSIDEPHLSDAEENPTDTPKIIEEDIEKIKKKGKDPKSRGSSSSNSKSNSSTDSPKDKSKVKDRPIKSYSNGDKDRRDRDKDRYSSSSTSSNHRRNSSSSGNSSSSKSSSSKDKDKKDSTNKKDTYKDSQQAEKDKDTLAKIQAQQAAIQKLGRIPKKSSSSPIPEKQTPKKPSFSIEVRKNSLDAEKPKTVKVYNAKMRSTGLLEEAKPPPPPSTRQNTAKKVSASPILAAGSKRSSSPPLKDTSLSSPSVEKKSRLSDMASSVNNSSTERPGAIKLIPPKPKRGEHIESPSWRRCSMDIIFMDNCEFMSSSAMDYG